MSRDGPACLSEKGQTMILTTEQQAEVAANRKRYEELKAAGQGHAGADPTDTTAAEGGEA